MQNMRCIIIWNLDKNLNNTKLKSIFVNGLYNVVYEINVFTTLIWIISNENSNKEIFVDFI